VNPLLVIMSENVLQQPQSIVVVDGESISKEHLQRESTLRGSPSSQMC